MQTRTLLLTLLRSGGPRRGGPCTSGGSPSPDDRPPSRPSRCRPAPRERGGGAGGALTWEQLPLLTPGSLQDAKDVVFLADPALGERRLLWISYYGPFQYDPDGDPETWTQLCTRGCAPRNGLVTDAGSVLIGAPAGATAIDRLPPGGPWEYEVNNAGGGTATLFQASIPTLRNADGHGLIFGGSYYAYRSDDDGRHGSWARLGEPGGEVVVFGEVPPSGALPQGRLLAGLYNGVAFSDDGGLTWAPGAGAYGFARFVADSFTFVPEPGHPYGGAALAGVNDLEFGRDSTATVYRSDDGGATWARVHRFSPSALGLENAHTVELLTTPDGAVWAGVTYRLGGLTRYRTGTVVRSGDGGRTWAKMAEGYGGHGIEAVRVGPDGRLYVGSVVGVWRTTAPLFAVAGEPGPGGRPAGGLSLAVSPNPTAGRATISLAMAPPGPVRVVVVDAVGREVAVVHDGPAADGQRFAVETAGLAAGAYRVRARTASGASASAGLTVAR